MILMQRLITSSTAAIRTSLERRLAVLELPQGQLSLFPEDVGEDWSSLDGQQQLDTILKTRLKGLKDERKEVELLLSAARRCEASGPDVKAEALLERIQQQQREENDPTLKVLIFTEFVPTQAMLADFLERRGFTVVIAQRRDGSGGTPAGAAAICGRRSDSHLHRRRWRGPEPAVLPRDRELRSAVEPDEDRAADRPCRSHRSEAHRAGDELRARRTRSSFASARCWKRSSREFSKSSASTSWPTCSTPKKAACPSRSCSLRRSIAPEEAEQRAAGVGRRDSAAGGGSPSRLQTAQCDRKAGPIGRAEDRQPPDAILDREADARLSAQSGVQRARRSSPPSLATICGGRMARPCLAAVFNRDDADRPGATLISLEDERVRGLTNSLPVFAPGQPIPSVVVPDVSDKTSGVWSLWRISLHTAGGREQRFLALFVSEDGRVFGPTARTIWDRLIDLPTGLSQATRRSLRRTLQCDAYDASRNAAEAQGAAVFEELVGCSPAEHRS